MNSEKVIISRTILSRLESRLADGKVQILFGPRQVGKTTLCKFIVDKTGFQARWYNGDESDIRILFSNPTSTRIKALIGNAPLVIFDEAQRFEDIGLVLKLLIDNYPELKIIATGSSAFELANKTSEPLTGRKWEYLLLPFSFEELAQTSDWITEKRMLNHRLTYGSYPAIVNAPGQEIPILKQLADSYLYKDILALERIQKPDRLVRMVTALALQIGSEVSYSELAQTCGLDTKTVEKYMDLLEKTYTIFRLPALSRNVRNELKKTRKVYFYDLGLRNALIDNFQDPSIRSDIGHLWENYLMIERIKWLQGHEKFVNRYFWRTTQQQEIDYIEEYAGVLHAYEFKWGAHKHGKFSKTFLDAYPNSVTHTISPSNYETFITGDGLF